MHPEIEKLIAIAKDDGKLTDRQREIILRRARELGTDIDDVEFELEDIRLSERKTVRQQPDEMVRREELFPIFSPSTESTPISAEPPYTHTIHETKEKSTFSLKKLFADAGQVGLKGCFIGCLILFISVIVLFFLSMLLLIIF